MLKEATVLDDEIRNSEAIKYYYRIKSLVLNYYVFFRNFVELDTLFNSFNSPMDIIKIWDENQREKLEQTDNEVVRRLLNYVLSAKALIDYTRNSIKTWYSGTDFERNYQKEIESRFVNNELAGFFEDLRIYSSHYSLLITFPQFTISNMNTENQVYEHKFLISKEILMDWKNWTKGKNIYSKHLLT